MCEFGKGVNILRKIVVVVAICLENLTMLIVPYRGERRYNIMAHKCMLLDAGHICQNLYLDFEVIGSGKCGIGAYEFVIYLAPVGKIPIISMV